MFKFIKNMFKKNKIDMPMPYEFAIIKFTNIAHFKGIYDEENKIVEHYKGGKLFKTYPYNVAVLNSLKIVDEIPIIDLEEIQKDEEFSWEEPTEFGVVKIK